MLTKIGSNIVWESTRKSRRFRRCNGHEEGLIRREKFYDGRSLRSAGVR